MIFLGQASLRHAVKHFMAHYHAERNHQGLGNQLLQPVLLAATQWRNSAVGTTAGSRGGAIRGRRSSAAMPFSQLLDVLQAAQPTENKVHHLSLALWLGRGVAVAEGLLGRQTDILEKGPKPENQGFQELSRVEIAVAFFLPHTEERQGQDGCAKIPKTDLLADRAFGRWRCHGCTDKPCARVSGEFASSGDRGLKQTPTVLLPSMAIKRCASRG